MEVNDFNNIVKDIKKGKIMSMVYQTEANGMIKITKTTLILKTREAKQSQKGDLYALFRLLWNSKNPPKSEFFNGDNGEVITSEFYYSNGGKENKSNYMNKRLKDIISINGRER